ITNSGGDGEAVVPVEVGAVAAPVAVEADLPRSFARQADGVAAVCRVAEVEHHDHVVVRTAGVPSMKGEHFGALVDVEDVHPLAEQAASGAGTVSAKADEIAVEEMDSCMRGELLPIE